MLVMVCFVYPRPSSFSVALFNLVLFLVWNESVLSGPFFVWINKCSDKLLFSISSLPSSILRIQCKWRRAEFERVIKGVEKMPVSSISYPILMRLHGYNKILKFSFCSVQVGDATVFTGFNFRYTRLSFMALYSVLAVYHFCLLHVNSR